jgi:membrane fusion protein (multidrug efflux system)
MFYLTYSHHAHMLKHLKLLLLVATSLLTAGCREDQARPQKPLVNVKTQIITPQTIPENFEYVGFTKSSHQVQIRARVEGYLDEIAYTEGGLVKEGDLLFQLDPKPFKASLESAKGALARQEAILWNAEQTLKRFKPLYEQHAASLRDLENAMASQKSAEADVMSAKANVYQAELNLGYTTIRSPINALSGQSNYREGALIMPAGSEGLLTTLSVIDPIWAIFNVPEQDLLKYNVEVSKHQLIFPPDLNFNVQLILADNSIFPNLGKVNFASPTLDPTTGTMTVRAVVPNPDNILKPGQFVRARLLGAKRPNSLLVPQSAVLRGSRGMFVYLVDDDEKVVLRNIEVGKWVGDNWIVTGGLASGEAVIVSGINKVVVGESVNVISSSEEEPAEATSASPTVKSQL